MPERILKIGLQELQTFRIAIKGDNVVYEVPLDRLPNMAGEFHSNPRICHALAKLEAAITDLTSELSPVDVEIALQLSD